MERLGLGVEVLRQNNSRLIACSITGFGEDGPYKDRPAYDAVAQGLSGITSMFLADDDAQLTGPTIADNMTGYNACYGVLGALFERERTGRVRRVEVNMMESAIAFIPDPFLNAQLAGVEPGPLMRVSASQSYAVRCADGKALAIHMSSQEKFWQAMQRAFDRTDLGTDPRFDDRTKRIDNYLALADEFQKTAVTQPHDYWACLLYTSPSPRD